MINLSGLAGGAQVSPRGDSAEAGLIDVSEINFLKGAASPTLRIYWESCTLYKGPRGTTDCELCTWWTLFDGEPERKKERPRERGVLYGGGGGG